MSYNEIQMKKRISALAKEARETARLSRPAMAEQAGISTKTIYSFENGDTWPQATRLAAICKVLGWEYEKIDSLLRSEREPATLTLEELKADEWGQDRPRFVSDLTDEELLTELTFRFQKRNQEIRQLRESSSNVTPLHRSREFDESLPHAAHPGFRLESSQFDGLGEDPQD